MAYRAYDEASESHVFRCPDHEQRRIRRLSDQDGSGVAAGELDQPIRAWVDLVEYRRNAGSVTRINFIERQVPLRLSVEAWAAHPEWPTQRMNCAQHQARMAARADLESSSPTTISRVLMFMLLGL